MIPVVRQITKRNGATVPYDRERVTLAIYKAAAAIGGWWSSSSSLVALK